MASHALASSKGGSSGEQEGAASRRAFFCLLQQLSSATVVLGFCLGFSKGNSQQRAEHSNAGAVTGLGLQHIHRDLVLQSQKNSHELVSDVEQLQALLMRCCVTGNLIKVVGREGHTVQAPQACWAHTLHWFWCPANFLGVKEIYPLVSSPGQPGFLAVVL